MNLKCRKTYIWIDICAVGFTHGGTEEKETPFSYHIYIIKQYFPVYTNNY